jgi:hypothetical protein
LQSMCIIDWIMPSIMTSAYCFRQIHMNCKNIVHCWSNHEQYESIENSGNDSRFESAYKYLCNCSSTIDELYTVVVALTRCNRLDKNDRFKASEINVFVITGTEMPMTVNEIDRHTTRARKKKRKRTNSSNEELDRCTYLYARVLSYEVFIACDCSILLLFIVY